jgi:DNA-binding Lrp family transcriptional regulator
MHSHYVSEEPILPGVKAYVFCKVSSGSERETCKRIAEYPFVSEVCIVYGEYDLIVEIYTEDLEELDSATEEIRNIPSITYTSTMIVGRGFPKKR